MPPSLSYTIWFSQRTGSTLLAKALETTGLAGRPNEWLSEHMFSSHYGQPSPAALQQHLWQLGSSPNGVFGVKHGYYEPYFSRLLETLRSFPTCDSPALAASGPRAALWECAFPNHRHIFMTRRNKVRLAVSWWKAIQSAEWHRTVGQAAAAQPANLRDAYHFDALRQLYNESIMREAGTQEFFSEAGIVPLTVVYEDFILDYTATIRRVLDFLGLDSTVAPIEAPFFAQLADEVSEEWTQRFRRELQSDWDNIGW